MGFTREIIDRRILPAAGVYIGASWVVVEILDRLVEKGKIAVRKAYADWGTFSTYKRQFHEHAVELVDQTKLPVEFEELTCGDVETVWEAVWAHVEGRWPVSSTRKETSHGTKSAIGSAEWPDLQLV